MRTFLIFLKRLPSVPILLEFYPKLVSFTKILQPLIRISIYELMVVRSLWRRPTWDKTLIIWGRLEAFLRKSRMFSFHLVLQLMVTLAINHLNLCRLVSCPIYPGSSIAAKSGTISLLIFLSEAIESIQKRAIPINFSGNEVPRDPWTLHSTQTLRKTFSALW